MNKLGKLRCGEAKKFEFELKGLKMNKNGKSRCEEEKFCFTGPAERAITASSYNKIGIRKSVHEIGINFYLCSSSNYCTLVITVINSKIVFLYIFCTLL